MVKEKRAFTDESLQDTPLRKELNVTGREATDVMPLAEAEAAKSSLYFNPKIFEDLATISRNEHDVRRTRNAYDFATEQDMYKREQELMQDRWEITKKRQLDNYLSTAEIAYLTSMQEEYEKAVRENRDVEEAITIVDQRFQKLGDDMWQKAPYLGDAFHKARQNMFMSYQKQAINSEFIRAEAKAEYNYDVKTNILANQLRRSTSLKPGDQAAGINGYSIDDAIADYPKALFPYLDTLSDSSWGTKVNNGYNTILTSEVNRIAEAVDAGEMDIISARNQLLNLRAKYSVMDLTGPLNKAGEEERLATLRVTMDDKVQEKIKATLFSLDSKGSNSEPVYVYDAFYEATDGKAIRDGKATLSSHLPGTSYLKATEDVQDRVRALAQLVASGNKSARQDLINLVNYSYKEYLPSVMATEIIKHAHAKTGKAGEGIAQIQEAIREISNYLSQGNNADPEPRFASLIIADSAGTVYADMNNNLTDEELFAIYGYANYGDIKRDIAKGMLNTFQQYLDSYDKNGGLAPLVPEVRSRKVKLEQDFSVGNMLAKDPEKDIVAFRKDTIPQSVLDFKQYRKEIQARTGNEDATHPTIDIIKAASDQVKNQRDPRVKTAAAMYVSNVLRQAGSTDALLTIDHEAAGIDKEFLQDVQSFSILGKADESYIYRVQAADNDRGLIDNRDVKDLSIFTKLDAGNYKTALDYVSDQVSKQVPIQYRHAAYEAISRAIIADYQLSGKKIDEYKAPVKRICSEVISKNWTESGIYRHAEVFQQGISVEDAEEEAVTYNEVLNHLYWNLNLPKELAHSININEKAGEIEFKLLERPLYAEGEYAPLSGTKVYPLSIPLKVPEGMDPEAFKKANVLLVTGTASMMTAAAITDPMSPRVEDSWLRDDTPAKKLEGIMKGWTGKDSNQEFVRLLSVLTDKDFRNAWYDYVRNDGEHVYIAPAPVAYKSALKALIASEKHGTSGYTSSGVNIDRNMTDSFIDFLYSYGAGDARVRLDRSANTEAASKEIPQRDIQEAIINAGGGGYFRVTSTTGGEHATPIHASGKAIDIGFGPKAGDWRVMYYTSGPNAGKANIERVGLLLSALRTWIENGTIDKIVVGPAMKDLVSGVGTSEDYKIFRQLKNKKGQPLFRLIQPEIEKEYTHNNHWHVQLSKKMFNPDGTPFEPVKKLQKSLESTEKREEIVSKYLEENVKEFKENRTMSAKYLEVKNNALDFLPPDSRQLVNDVAAGVYTNINSHSSYKVVSPSEAKAVVTLFGTREATDWDAKNSGRTKEELNESFFTKSVAQANRYAIFKRHLGYKNAVHAMYEGTFDINVLYTLETNVDEDQKANIKTMLTGLVKTPKNLTGEQLITLLQVQPELHRYIRITPKAKGDRSEQLNFKLFERAGY